MVFYLCAIYIISGTATTSRGSGFNIVSDDKSIGTFHDTEQQPSLKSCEESKVGCASYGSFPAPKWLTFAEQRKENPTSVISRVNDRPHPYHRTSGHKHTVITQPTQGAMGTIGVQSTTIDDVIDDVLAQNHEPHMRFAMTSTEKQVPPDTNEPSRYAIWQFIVDLLKLGTMKAMIENRSCGNIYAFQITNFDLLRKSYNLLVPRDDVSLDTFNKEMDLSVQTGFMSKVGSQYTFNLYNQIVFNYIKIPKINQISDRVINSLYKMGAGTQPQTVLLWKLVIDLLSRKPAFDMIVKDVGDTKMSAFVVNNICLLNAAWTRVAGIIYRGKVASTQWIMWEDYGVLTKPTKKYHPVHTFNKNKSEVKEYRFADQSSGL